MCPHCGIDNSKVVETRRHYGSVYRRRACREFDCGKSFISEETAPEGLQFPAEIREESIRRLVNKPSKSNISTVYNLHNIWRSR